MKIPLAPTPAEASLLELARRLVLRGGWFNRIGIHSLSSHFFPTTPAGKPKRHALCGTTNPGVPDADERWFCRSCLRRAARLGAPAGARGGAARSYAS